MDGLPPAHAPGLGPRQHRELFPSPAGLPSEVRGVVLARTCQITILLLLFYRGQRCIRFPLHRRPHAAVTASSTSASVPAWFCGFAGSAGRAWRAACLQQASVVAGCLGRLCHPSVTCQPTVASLVVFLSASHLLSPCALTFPHCGGVRVTTGGDRPPGVRTRKVPGQDWPCLTLAIFRGSSPGPTQGGGETDPPPT